MCDVLISLFILDWEQTPSKFGFTDEHDEQMVADHNPIGIDFDNSVGSLTHELPEKMEL